MVDEAVYAEVRLRHPHPCQIASISESGTTVRRASRTAVRDEEGRIVEEVEVEEVPDDVEPTPVAVDEPNGVFRFKRPVGQGCACERVEHRGCPIRSSHADSGELFMTFYAEEIGTVREIIADLKEVTEGVDLQRLYQTGDETDGGGGLVYIDSGLFTERQREVLEAAHDMGYFDYPKGANAGAVAAELGITTATLVEHLSAAQSKLLDAVLDA